MYKDHNDKFLAFTNVFRYVLDKHTPWETKTIRGNHAPFMTKKWLWLWVDLDWNENT